MHFFFYLYRAHRALHSFPTRRSSDLSTGAAILLDYQGAPRAAGGGFGFSPRARYPRIQNGRGEVGSEKGDRKSTRLNSSHMSISYAVFCLKKKNMKMTSCWRTFFSVR